MQDFDPATHTNAQVEQYHVVYPAHQKMVSAIVETILYIIQQSKLLQHEHCKIIVFFPTTSLVTFYADLFNFGLNIKVMELHSRKTQAYRTSVSNRFREVSQGILFTTDVSARGVDYPNVTHVVQFGMADGRETYIHRLGRTGRAGKRGQGIAVLSDIEGPGFLKHCVSDLDVAKRKEKDLLDCIMMGDSDDIKSDFDPNKKSLIGLVKEEAKRLLEPVIQSIRNGQNDRLQEAAEDAYRSMLGFYVTKLPSVGVNSKRALVEKVNAFARQAGLNRAPTLSAKLARNLGLDQVTGLNIREELDNQRIDSISNRVFENSRGKVQSSKIMAKARMPSYNEWGKRTDENRGGRND